MDRSIALLHCDVVLLMCGLCRHGELEKLLERSTIEADQWDQQARDMANHVQGLEQSLEDL